MDIYFAFHLDSKDEILLAFLSELGFESFVEEGGTTIGYISQGQHEVYASDINATIQKFNTTFRVEKILPQNWNALWEESFQPVVIDQFCVVRADFHPPHEDVVHDIIINPRMAFGTGHHATTYLMIKSMQDLDFSDKNVFDYGAGTGILAILAAKMGAKKVDAIDIEEEAYTNIQLNANINQVLQVHPIHGTLDHIEKSKKYHVILANINRNILLQSVEVLHDLLLTDGTLLLSGILVEDQQIIRDKFALHHFLFVSSIIKDNWACLRFSKHPA